MRYLLLTLLLVWFLDAQAQDHYTAGQLVEDFSYFVDALEQTHPDPYTAYGGKIGFQKSVQNYRDRIAEATTVERFRDLVTEFVAPLHDGHTGLNSSRNENSGEPELLPVVFQIATDGLFIRRTTASYNDLVGQRVVAVNGEPLESLLQRTGIVAPSENQSGLYHNLRRMLQTRHGATRLFTLNNDSLALTIAGNQGAEREVVLDYQVSPTFVPGRSTANIKPDNGLLYWQMIGEDGDVGYFVWNSMVSREVVEQVHRDAPEWTENNLQWAYSFMPNVTPSGNLEESIQKIPSLYEEFHALLAVMKAKEASHLIIDLRRNSGGMTPLVRPLLYMMYGDEYLIFDYKTEYNRLLSPLFLKKMGFENIEELNEAWNTDFMLGDFQFGSFFGGHEDQSLEERRDLRNITYSGLGAEYVEALQGEPFYTPRIVVLTSPSTFSAAYHFMYFLWKLGKTSVVGVPPRQAGNTFMETTQFTLPNTRLSGSISNAVQIFFPNDPERGRLFMPEFPMHWSDFQRYDFDEDAEILYALDLIEEGKIDE